MQNLLFSGRSQRALALILSTMAAGCVGANSAVASEAPHRIVVAQAEKPSAQGTINAVDANNRKLKITHGPIAALKWPGMTMDFGVAPSIDLTTVMPGMKISFTLSRDANDKYVIDLIKPAE